MYLAGDADLNNVPLFMDNCILWNIDIFLHLNMDIAIAIWKLCTVEKEKD